jgi:MtrB/PioB family decaheme-associated outer membrane protein
MIIALIVTLIPFSVVFSEETREETRIEGEVSVKGVYVGVKGGEGGEAKFTEYKDLEEHWRVFGNVDLGLDSEKYFLNLQAEDIAYDTQRYILDGGIWGKFKFDLFYDEIPHNLTFDARTYYEGAGSHHLTSTPNLNFNTWNTFDYSIDRKQYGVGFKFPLLKPVFFDVSFQREERDGIKAAGLAASSPGGFIVEAPEPIDYTTNNLKLEGGYARKPFFLSFGFIYSDFRDSNDKLTFAAPTSPFLTDTLSLPPDNHYYKGTFKGSLKLPLNSNFNVNLGYGVARSDTTLVDSYVSGAARTTFTLSQPDFDGKIKTKNYAFVLTSNPLNFFDAKLSYKYYKKDNENDVVRETTATDIFFNLPFEYKREAAGIDLGFRLPVRFLLSTGYKFIKTDRKEKGVREATDGVIEEPFPENKDNVYSAELRWNGLDFVTPKVGFEKLIRSADFKGSKPENRRFAYAGQSRETYRAGFDVFPFESLNLGLNYYYKKIDYKEIIGLKEDKRNGFDISADYAFRRLAKLYGYFDYEWIRFHPDQFKLSAPAGAWVANQKDRTWGYGIGTEFYVIPGKLTLLLQHDYLKSNGDVNFTLDPISLIGVAGADNDNVDIMRWDDYTKYALKFKAAYNLTKSLTISAGYVYERFRYNDIQLDGYQFVNPLGGPVAGSSGAYLTGYQKDQSYRANLIFGGITYNF